MTPLARIELEYILASHALWLAGNPAGVRADLWYADLRGADLRGADLRYADLTGANLKGANLKGANFWYAILRGAILPTGERWASDV